MTQYSTPSYLPMRNENWSPQKYVESSLIYSRPKLEATQMPINKRMDKQIEIYSFNGILLSNKKNRQSIDIAKY